MQIASGKVVGGRVELESELPEGAVVTVLAHGNHPEWYGLPADPHVPLMVRVWKSVLRPLGMFAIFGSVIAAFAHFMTEGPKEVKEGEGEGRRSP